MKSKAQRLPKITPMDNVLSNLREDVDDLCKERSNPTEDAEGLFTKGVSKLRS